MLQLKSSPPRCEGLIRREHLLRSVRQDAACLWLYAPAGSGKTSLLADYIAWTGRPVIWYQLDRTDADPVAFFTGLMAACKRAGIRRLPSFRADYARDLAGYGRALLSAVLEQAADGILIAFDNLEWLPEDSVVHQLLSDLVALRPAGVQCLIASRNAPSGVWLPLVINNAIHSISADGLRLTVEEITRLASRRGSQSTLTAEQLERLLASTGGWVGGCLIGLEQLAAGGALQSLDTDQIFHFFANEVLLRADQKLQHFLLRTCVLPSFDVESAIRISGDQDAARILQDIYRRQFFIDRRGFVSAQYQYHPLFRQFLLGTARERWSDEIFNRWITDAVTLLDARGQIQAALALAEELGEWPLIAELITRHGQSLLAGGQVLTLIRLLEGMPRQRRICYPELDYWQGMALLLTRPGQARHFLEQYYLRLQQGGALQRRYDVWMAVVQTYLIEFGCYAELDRWLDEFDLLQREGRVRGLRRRGQIHLTLYAALAFRRPDDSRLADLNRLLNRYISLMPDCDERLLAAGALGFFAAMTGDVQAFRRYSTILERGAAQASRTPFARLLASLVRTMYLWYAEDPARGEAAAQEGLALAEDLGIRSLDFMFLLMATYACHAAGEHDRAGQYLQRIPLAITQERRTFYGNYLWLLGWDGLLRGHSQAALRYFSACTDMAEEVGMPYATCQAWYGRAQAELHCGNLNAARNAAQLSLVLSERYGFRPFRALSLLTSADIAEQAGDLSHARASLQSALTHMRDDQLPHLPYWQASSMSRLLSLSLQHDVVASYATELIGLRRLRCPAGQEEVWPWQLSITVLGEFRVVSAGQGISMPRRLPKKPLELLALLICERRQWSLSELMLTLWPEADESRGQAALKTTLARLRRLIGTEAIRLQRSHLTLDASMCQVDWWRLQDLTADGWRQALSLYQGEMFSSLRGEEWLEEYCSRMRLHVMQIFLRGLCCAELDGDLIIVERLANVLLKDDPACEPAWQALIRMHLHRGDQVLARQIMDRCATVLKRELGVAPSAETRALLVLQG